MEVMQSKDRIVIKGSCEYSLQDKYTIDVTEDRLLIALRDGDINKGCLVRINKRNARMLAKMLQEFYETEV